MRKAFLLLILSLLTISANTQESSSSKNLPWIPFSWVSECIDNRVIEKVSLSVPLRIEGLPYQFEAQFDLGAATSMLYGNTIKPYLEKYTKIKAQIDSSRVVKIQGEKCHTLANTKITLGDIVFPKTDFVLFDGFGDVMTTDSINTPTVKHIGTIAANLFSKQILIIDYSNQQLCAIDDLPENFDNKFDFVDVEYIEEQNWIFIPMTIGGQTRKVLFDTGSSMFPLLSSHSNIASIAQTTHCIDSLSVSAWGNQVKVYGYTPKEEVRIGSIKFAPLTVYASEYLDNETLEEAGFWGIIGNRYFLDRTIIVDYKNKRLGVSKK